MLVLAFGCLAVAVVSSCLLDVVLRGFPCLFCVFGRCCLLYRCLLDLQFYRYACSTCSFCFARCLLFFGFHACFASLDAVVCGVVSMLFLLKRGVLRIVSALFICVFCRCGFRLSRLLWCSLRL